MDTQTEDGYYLRLIVETQRDMQNRGGCHYLLGLIESCKELVVIYAKRDQQNLLAGISTSLSEALRAGYCMGVADEYRRHNRCYRHDWFTQASRGAEMPVSFAKRTSVRALLEHSCGI